MLYANVYVTCSILPSPPLKSWLPLRFDYDTTIPRCIRLQQKWSKLRFDCDTTTTRLWRKIDTLIFALVELRRMKTGACDTSKSDRSRIVAYITIAIRLRQDYDTSYTTIPWRIRLRQKWSKLRFGCDTTTTYRSRLLPFDAIRREQKININFSS